jgi:hypothetical protein
MTNQTASTLALIVILVVQLVVAYALSLINPLTLTGQRIAAFILAFDALLFAGLVRVYHKHNSQVVFKDGEED